MRRKWIDRDDEGKRREYGGGGGRERERDPKTEEVKEMGVESGKEESRWPEGGGGCHRKGRGRKEEGRR